MQRRRDHRTDLCGTPHLIGRDDAVHPAQENNLGTTNEIRKLDLKDNCCHFTTVVGTQYVGGYSDKGSLR